MNKNKFRVSRSACLILLAVVTCTPAFAQHGSGLGGSFNDPAGGMITKTIMDRMARRRLEKTRRVVPASNDAPVLFRPTGTQLKTREIANLIDAGNAQVFTILTTILQEYEKGARAAGHANDLALALSFFFATNASIYHDAGQPADPPMVELRDTIAEALVEGNALSSMSNRQKQEMYETLVLFTGFTLATYEEGKQGGNAETVKVSQQLAGQNLLALTGISPDKINFTDQGLSIEREPEAATATQSPAEPTNAPSATVNAGKLVIDFEGNEVRANQIYGGKRIRVNGTVNSIDVQKNGSIVLTFHSPAAGYAQTQCYFNKSQSSRLAQLNGGQEAIVEGTVRGIGGGMGGKGLVVLETCTVP